MLHETLDNSRYHGAAQRGVHSVPASSERFPSGAGHNNNGPAAGTLRAAFQATGQIPFSLLVPGSGGLPVLQLKSKQHTLSC